MVPRRVESMLKELKQAAGLGERLTGSILDQGDAVGAWLGDSMAVVVFPTAETLKHVGPRATTGPSLGLVSVAGIIVPTAETFKQMGPRATAGPAWVEAGWQA